MPLTIAQATRRARQGRSGLGGLCLAFSRWCYGIPSKYPSADQAWKNARYRVVQSHTRGMPVGAFIHMYSPRSTYQHIGIYMGGGLFATTDSGRSRTYVGTVSSWQRAGYSIRGWAADCNGVTVPELKKVYDRVKGKTSTSAAPGKIRVDGYWGRQTKMRWQQVLGTKVDGVISKPYSQMVAKIQQGLGLKVTGRWDRHLTLALQKRYGTTQDGKTSKPSQWVRKLQARLNKGTW